MSLLLKLLTSIFVSRDDCQILLLIGFGSVERIANDWGIFWQDYDDFVEDGIPIEPFNLNKEREEGYFDADGNFVEYANKNEVEDAWLDSVEVDTKYAGKGFAVTKDDDDVQDLSSDDVGKIKRRIADVLEPGETVLQALRRLKGTSNNKKEKMSAETKRVFDQLTEDATNLMDNGESNVYHEKKEMFEREAGKLCYSEIINQGSCDQYRLQGLELQGLYLGEVEGYGCQKCECSTSQRICW
ncbi:hypothetical protein PRUPE_8G061500 [Prunus persica]|uniref:OCRE domain-containing protein n=1 Tax=Prunus persica TaxID=3760 RepID=A0A251MWB6_PRUPE|nr:hypothetical protein PRUPE_8G061500 [Prunus persica]